MTVLGMVITANAVFLTIRENLGSVKVINITQADYFYSEVIHKLLLKDIQLNYKKKFVDVSCLNITEWR